MDHDSVDKIKLSKYGCGLNLIRFSFFLSIFGIVVSTLGTIGGIASIAIATQVDPSREYGGFDISDPLYVTGITFLILMIPYLAMWILLNIKARKRNIASIEKIVKIYSYVSGSMEIMAMLFAIGVILFELLHWGPFEGIPHILIAVQIGTVIFGLSIFATIPILVACLKIHGIRLEKNKLLSVYLGFRYVILLPTTLSAIMITLFIPAFWTDLMLGVLFFILDIGLTVILHSIREDRGNFDGIENPFLNEWIE